MSIIGIDTGGTFTDLVVLDPTTGRITATRKVPSSPADPAAAVLRALEGERPRRVVHGTTVATNAVLERRLARVALVTNAGLEDVIEIGRQARPHLYALHPRTPPPLVPPELRFGVAARMEPDGSAVRDPDPAALAALRSRLAAAGIEAVAICLLHSYASGAHERAVAQALAPLGLPITLSHEILPEFREFERFSTAVVNAALVPLLSRYLVRLGARVPSLWVMRSDGGVAPAARLAREPVWTLLSGPAGGVLGAARAAAAAGVEPFISIDVGGTSTDVALSGAPLVAGGEIGGVRVAHPSVDLVTIGAGGGSIAWVDAGGALRVGPHSAGAEPGPACYGRGGTEPTLTDAWVVLGRLGEAGLLGGGFALDAEAARAALARLGARLGLGAAEAARGVVEVALAATERAVRRVSVERGEDPRERALVAFGGAGGLVAAELVRRLGMRGALVPLHPGLLSAVGMAQAELVVRRTRTLLRPLGSVSEAELVQLFAELEQQARAELQAELDAEEPAEVRLVRELDVRYRGQSHELRIGWRPGSAVRAAFEQEHERRNRFRDPEREVELVAARLTALAGTPGVCARPPAIEAAGTAPRAAAAPRAVTAAGALYERSQLAAGVEIRGPALVCEYSATTYVPADFTLRVLADGALWLAPGAPAGGATG
ncbi:MAG: N-methylhydantoinase A [Planctomycetota bacterium]|nr:MAG: N-methylhydantoinase A [Planctomycetota bacterium]